MKSRTLKLLCAGALSMGLATPAIAGECDTYKATVHAALVSPPAGIWDQDLILAEDLFGQGVRQCDKGNDAQAMELLDEAMLVLGN